MTFSPKNKISWWFYKWVLNPWWEGEYLLRYGVKRPHWIEAKFYRGYDFPFSEYGYAIYFKRTKS